MSAASRVDDESNSVIHAAIRSRDTGALFELAVCCWPELILELFDVCPVAPADGGPLPPPFDGPVGFGDGLDDAGDDIFMIVEQDERKTMRRKESKIILVL